MDRHDMTKSCNESEGHLMICGDKLQLGLSIYDQIGVDMLNRSEGNLGYKRVSINGKKNEQNQTL